MVLLPCQMVVWIPYGFTLLSNIASRLYSATYVWIPYGFTLLSNIGNGSPNVFAVWIPYGFTLLSNIRRGSLKPWAVWIPYGFTLLSNKQCWNVRPYKFESPMDLHYSQTVIWWWINSMCLNPLWIYTTLKPSFCISFFV